MIRVVKPAAPSILLDKGAAKRAEDEAAYEVGERSFAFDRGIYAHDSVRRALARAQHDKCCFCERKIEAGDVEHFRPKAGFRQARYDPLETPGYYWLAYEWTNLDFACKSCNQRNKHDLFPLRDPARRVLTMITPSSKRSSRCSSIPAARIPSGCSATAMASPSRSTGIRGPR